MIVLPSREDVAEDNLLDIFGFDLWYTLNGSCPLLLVIASA
jgi:hypothetical protein